jgi:hypothetical protein
MPDELISSMLHDLAVGARKLGLSSSSSSSTCENLTLSKVVHELCVEFRKLKEKRFMRPLEGSEEKQMSEGRRFANEP